MKNKYITNSLFDFYKSAAKAEVKIRPAFQGVLSSGNSELMRNWFSHHGFEVSKNDCIHLVGKSKTNTNPIQNPAWY